MEAKKILGLIKDDIAHLEDITSEFSIELLPSADDVDLAIIRAKALLTELELLQRLTSTKNPEYYTFPTTEFQTINTYSHIDRTKEPIETIETAIVQDKIHIPVPEAEEILQTDIDQEIVSVNKVQNPKIEQVAPITESLVEKEQMVENKTLVANDHKKEVTNHTGIEEQKSINERLRENSQVNNDFLPNENSSLGYPITPIKLIWDAIGINDRFLFVRELFDNNSSKFESTVRAIDKLTSIQEAVNYLKLNFKWNNSEASQRFLILVKQRFTK